MKKFLLLGTGGLLLIALLALASFAAAAPPLNPTPPPAQSATSPTPESDTTGDTQDQNSPDSAAVITPVPPGTMTSKIIVFNPNAGTATVGITIVKPDGSTAYTFPTFTVATNGAVVKSLPASITSPFNGSAVVSSDKNVQAYVTNNNTGNSARDEYNGSSGTSSTLTLPLVRHLSAGKQHSIITLQNTSGTAGNVTLHLYDPSGSEVGTGTVVAVQPSASAFINTDSLFPSSTFTGTGLLVADPGLTIASAEQTEYFKDTASFQGLTAADADTTLYLPFVERRRNSTGGILSWNEIFVRNNGGSPTDITAKFYTAAGVLKLSITRSAVPANGQAQFLLNKPEFASLTTSTAYFSGWATITSTGQPVSAFALDAQNSGARLFGLSAVPLGQVGIKYACGDTFRFSSPSQNSKINLVNLGAATANVTVRLYKPGTGAAAGAKTYAVGPKKLVIANLSDSSFSAAGSTFEGLAIVTSSSSSIVVSVNTQYASGGITSFSCSKLQ